MLGRLGRWAVRCLDALLRRAHGVYEFSPEPECILRLALGRSERETTLADGTHIAAGERIGELHLWNERLPPMPQQGPDFRWALTMRRRLVRSLQLLAVYVENDQTLRDIRAFRGETVLDLRWSEREEANPLARLGLELRSAELAGPLKRFTDFWENLYGWWLIWTFNPGSLRSKRFWRLQRCQLWISRQALLNKYGRAGQEDVESGDISTNTTKIT